MKINKKGFSLTELLATIIIIAIVIAIAVPAVSNYIETSRRKSYVSSAFAYIKSVRNYASAYKYRFTNSEAVYYLPVECIEMHKKTPSPYGEYIEAYVVVITDGTNPEYYWTSYDKTGHGMELTQEKEIKQDSIIINKFSIDKNIPVKGRMVLIEMNKDTCEF